MSSLADAGRAEDVGAAAAGNSLAVAVVFFVSGMPALVYQLIWQRSLFTMYGINVEAVTVVVAGFLLGLGFGSLAGGRLSRVSSANLLALFGIIEIIIGAFGVSSLHIIDFVGHKTPHLPIVPLTMVDAAAPLRADPLHGLDAAHPDGVSGPPLAQRRPLGRAPARRQPGADEAGPAASAGHADRLPHRKDALGSTGASRAGATGWAG